MEKKRKFRTSFELRPDIDEFLVKEAQRLDIPPSELLRRIIDAADNNTDLSLYQRKYKNLTLHKTHMEKLEKLGHALIPDNWKGKRGVNRGQVVEILIDVYMTHQKKNDTKDQIKADIEALTEETIIYDQIKASSGIDQIKAATLKCLETANEPETASILNLILKKIEELKGYSHE